LTPSRGKPAPYPALRDPKLRQKARLKVATRRYTESMRDLRTLTPQEFARAERRLRYPAPGSKIEAAKLFGVDIFSLIEQLRLSPAERSRQMQRLATSAESLRGGAQRAKR
jgi:hypothetical protein